MNIRWIARAWLAMVPAWTLAASISGADDDWPTWQHDNQRTGCTSQTLPAERLQLTWKWQSSFPPQPAWAGPALRDAFANLENLPAMRNYDPVFHVIGFDDRVAFGSSSDDTVYCLNAASGEELWRFVCDAPVRTAPTFSQGRLLFGCDDGHAYCLAAADGALLWKFQPPGLDQRRVLNNGRLISLHPCRTGVMVAGETAWCGFSMLPWDASFLCGLRLDDGRPEGPGGFVQQLQNRTLEGPPALAAELLAFPQGRVAPQLFRRADGHDLGPLQGSGGGSIVVVAPQSQLLHGPATDSRRGGIRASNPQTRQKIASYGRANALAVAGQRAVLLTDTELAVSDLAQRQTLWKTATDCNHSLIIAGETIFVGGDDQVAAYRLSDGEPLWRHPVEGAVYGLAVANGRLLVSTDAGLIAAFAPGDDPSTPSPAAEQAVPAPGDLTPIDVSPDPRLHGRWVFQQPHANNRSIADLAGKLPATSPAALRLLRIGERQALDCDGSQRIEIAADHRTADLPTRKLSLESWVRVDQPQPWGGIIGALQDNGSFERGWILGIKGQRFSFALASEQGPPRLTYLTASVDFALGKWRHVAATYDGQRMKLYVDGQLAAESAEQRGPIREPPRAFYEIGAYHDQDEDFRLRGAIHEVRVYQDVLGPDEIAEHYCALSGQFPQSGDNAVPSPAVGPWLEFIAAGTARVRWRTEVPCPSVLHYAMGEAQSQRVSDSTPKTEHQLLLQNLPRNRQGAYWLELPQHGKMAESQRFPLDTFFNYREALSSPTSAAPVAGGEVEPVNTADASSIRKLAGVDRGLCLTMECQSPRLLAELARQSEMRVTGFTEQEQSLRDARNALQEAGLYGGRVTVHAAADINQLPIVGELANLLVVPWMPASNDLPGGDLPDVAEVARLLRPGGGVAIVGRAGAPSAELAERLRSWAEGAKQHNCSMRIIQANDGLWARLERSPLPGAGSWTHLYGRPDNSAFGGEQLAGVSSSADLKVQWLGRPGPRYQADRNGRKPSPLAVNGRLFLQGLKRIIALDSFNGAVLWSLEIPHLERFNVPRDCSNWCADSEHLFAAVRGHVWQIDARDGRLQHVHHVQQGPKRDTPYHWGFLARSGQRLVGSTVQADASWTNFRGGAGWYDARSGEQTFKICSDNLFAVDLSNNETAWRWINDSVILNASVTIADGKVFFVECRNRDVVKGDSRRIGSPQFAEDQFLVALDLATGSFLWERPLPDRQNDVVFYMAHAADRLITVASRAAKYQVQCYSADGGKTLWKQEFGWLGGKGDHGKAMSRPAIVGDVVYVRPRALSLESGKLLPITMPGGGCGTYACTAGSLLFRAGTVTVWDRRSGRSSTWPRLRPDCWLSTIPSDGMLLSPEGGGGCSCGSWMETSIGFIPQAHRQSHR